MSEFRLNPVRTTVAIALLGAGGVGGFFARSLTSSSCKETSGQVVNLVGLNSGQAEEIAAEGSNLFYSIDQNPNLSGSRLSTVIHLANAANRPRDIQVLVPFNPNQQANPGSTALQEATEVSTLIRGQIHDSQSAVLAPKGTPDVSNYPESPMIVTVSEPASNCS